MTCTVTKVTAFLQIFFLFILPLVALVFGRTTVWFGFALSGVIIAAVIWIMLNEQWTLRDGGIRTDNFKNAVLPYTVFTVLALGGILVYARVFGVYPTSPTIDHSNTWLFAIPLSSIIQELVFRSFLSTKLIFLLDSLPLAIVCNAFLFTILHFLCPFGRLPLVLVFAGGLGFAAMYGWFPNLLLISASHSLLLYAITFLGLFLSFS